MQHCKNLLLLFLFLVPLSLFSQVNVKIEIASLPANHNSKSPIYIAGSFNGWNPQDEKFRFLRNTDSSWYIMLSLSPGRYEYKITRGGWDKVETKKDGSSIDNRVIDVPNDGVTGIRIEGWQDRFPPKPKKNTASANVMVIDSAFSIKQLNRVRRIWVYLPSDYFSVKTKYPVLYVHDGQNNFDEASAFSGEWGLDEFMDTTKLKKCIIVGIDHGGDKRLNEYNPYDSERFGKGEGDLYLEFIVKTLKPFIDKNYRTKKDKEATWMAGSSMGGLISMYGVLKYPKVFGGAGIFSPAFWVAPGIYDYTIKKGAKVKSKIYFYAGKMESKEMVPDMLKVFESMLKVSKARMTIVIRDEGKHNEATWRNEFPLFYSWLVN